MPRNVLVLVLDTARADAFEPYGAQAGSTPAVAQLASRGGAAREVFSTASWTLPSHASMFTGVMPRELGLGQAPEGNPYGAQPVVRAQEERLLPEVLRRAGWETKAVSTNVWVSPQAGFDTGFEEFELVHAGSRQERVHRDNLKGKLVWGLEGLRARQDDGAGQAGDTLERWIADAGDRPFFWFVNLVECHSPYLPPRPYNDLSAGDRIRAAQEARVHLSLEAIWRTCLGDFDVPADALERMRHLYARSITLMDDWIARILEALDGRGLLDDTTVLVTSDHGENFGEGGLLAHAFSIDDRLIRVPFVSNQAELTAGDGARSLVDLPRMIASHVGLAEHPWGESPLPTGIAAAQFDFTDEDDPRVTDAAAKWGLGEKAIAMMTEPLTCVTDGARKLQRRGTKDELYDLSADPLEETPGEPAAAPGTLTSALAEPALWRTGPESTAPRATGDDVEDLEARMRLLGYM